MITELIPMTSLIVTGIVLCWTTYGIFLNHKAKQSAFWLKVRDDFFKYDDVHLRLRPGGEWHSGKGPNSTKEWSRVEEYMGLFEHCESMLQQKLLDPKRFAKGFRYRIINIVANSTIKQTKLIEHADGWQGFLGLCERLQVPVARQDKPASPVD